MVSHDSCNGGGYFAISLHLLIQFLVVKMTLLVLLHCEIEFIFQLLAIA
jgi:hypothetical protein